MVTGNIHRRSNIVNWCTGRMSESVLQYGSAEQRKMVEFLNPLSQWCVCDNAKRVHETTEFVDHHCGDHCMVKNMSYRTRSKCNQVMNIVRGYGGNYLVLRAK